MTHIWFAFQVMKNVQPTPDDIICVTKTEVRLLEVLRDRAHSLKLFMTTTDNPAFQFEFKNQDLTNTVHSYIAVKELPLI